MKPIFLLLIVIHLPFLLFAHSKNNPKVKLNLLSPCNPSQSQTDLNINNVRARLLGGGDMWWDGKSVAKICNS
ncbi:MAG: hypothetical protein IPL95_11480 [Saprospiraceae bacterium]|nr:hypothetical protein [Saprospiraceae bacterium]